MREILFRGREITHGTWHCGCLENYFNSDGSYTIWEEKYHHGMHVDPKTIGQYTGLVDARGKRIFEGDIIRCTTCGFYGAVVWNSHGYFYIKEPSINNAERDCTPVGYMLEREDFKIIGNIYDNPDLLKGENKN
jgi:uncharacterized phage protein (TIGR01671 family)